MAKTLADLLREAKEKKEKSNGTPISSTVQEVPISVPASSNTGDTIPATPVGTSFNIEPSNDSTPIATKELSPLIIPPIPVVEKIGRAHV